MVPVLPAATRATDPTASTLRRVEACLGELKIAMTAVARRAEPAAVDLRPLADAVQAGFEGTSRQSAAINSAVLSLADRLSRIGRQDEHRVPRADGGAIERSAAPQSDRSAPRFVGTRDDHLWTSLLATAVLVLCWPVLLWFKTGSTNAVLGGVVGASAVASCLLAARRAGPGPR
jgi:hypothetical protein